MLNPERGTLRVEIAARKAFGLADMHLRRVATARRADSGKCEEKKWF
jgi:hypothetical protein